MIQAVSSPTENAFASNSIETPRRRSTFYVPLTIATTTNIDDSDNKTNQSKDDDNFKTERQKRSLDKIYKPESVCNYDWSLNESADLMASNEVELRTGVKRTASASTALFSSKNDRTLVDRPLKSISTSEVNNRNKIKRYGIVLNGSVNLDDDAKLEINDENQCHDDEEQKSPSSTSTPIKMMKSRSRSNILCLPDKSFQLSPLKEKSKTLPQNLSPKVLTSASASNIASHTNSSTFPPKYSFLLKSSPKISLNYSFDAIAASASSPVSSTTVTSPQVIDKRAQLALSPSTASSPRKALSFIRRAHSTKLSRSNSLLKSLTSKCVDQTAENLINQPVTELSFDRFEEYFKSDNFYALIKELFLLKDVATSSNSGLATSSTAVNTSKDHTENNKCDEEVHSDTSYEKACRRGSAPSTPILGQKNPPEQQSTSRFTNFFSKRSNPLKRTKSVTKLERSKRGPGGLRGSRSHESLLSSHAVMSTIDLSCTGAVGVAPVHQSVLGRRHCFQVRGGPRGERYYSCGSRQERDLWIYSLRKSIAPNAEHQRRTDNSLKMWIQEAKAITPKKRYFCEINLDKTLYGRTSVKQKTDLLFWGEYFDFPDIPDINVITVNVFREGDKKKKRDKHILVGSVKIPIHDVTKTTREFTEDWYPIVSEKHDSFSRNSTKEPIPTLRIKCRFQSIDILPIEIYTDFLQYMKEHYKKVCEILEPVILVKPKEDIGQALVLLMQAHGLAGPFLTDVVALDLLRVDDQRLTFRGNSLATKSMEAFLKLTGEQYLQDTLSGPITEIITSEKDFEVDPLKAHGSLSRQQQALRNAVKNTWNSIAESHRNFPPQLRECFATFRERLIELNREDMADNLISASIFLRFLCPAILSPSLFNIKNELPSQRATRNLTLVAKTLQTLANFTRFQGKEDFMEFLNDFLEQEAPRMKEFLHQISTRSTQPPVDTVLDWPGYIDEGKQLAILHHLLSENILKLPIPRQNELIELQGVLGEITRAKLSNSFGVSQTNLSESSHSTVQTHTLSRSESGNITSNSIIKPLGNGERGIMRGVLTPSSLEKNIFRYNDPTVSPLLNQENGGINRSQNSIYSNSIQHSHSTSSISSISNHNHNNYQNHLLSTTVHHHHHKNHAPSPERYAYLQQQQQKQQHQQYKSNVYLDSNASTASTASTPRNFNTTSHYYPTNGGGLNGRRSPSLRANTLPRNNNIIPVTTINNNGVHVEKNNSPAKNSNLIQIGLDTSSAFVRKSPTPMLKSQNNHNNNHIMQRNGSQLSLLSDRGGSQMQGSPHVNGKNAFNLDLGIPHSSLIDPPHPLHAVSARTTNHNSNMPMKLEDLDDLLKYADEQATSNGDEIKTAKVGSSTSIGHCSSGYQSIATQSQSSTSPVDLASGVNAPNANEFPSNSMKSRRALGQHISSANGKYQNSKYGNNNNNANIMNGGALAFKNPLYQLQNAIGVNGSNGTTIAINNNVGSNGKGRRPHYSQLHSRVSQQSSSLTPSSSDERLSQSNALDDSNGNTVNGLISNINGTLTSSSDKEHSLNDDCGSGTLNGNSSTLNSIAKRLTGSNNRMPRTNPLMQYKREEPIEPLAHHNHISHHLRFQRRTSLDSPHSGSDSSSEGEEVIRSEGKRRRFPRTVEQCEREIQRLQSSLDALRSHREDNGSDMGGRDSNDDLSMQHSDIKMRNIIAKLISMEKELRQEQMKMSVALTHKQRVIEAQGQQIAALDAANNRLLSALSSLRQRYETVNQSPNSSINPNHSAHC